MEQQAPVTVGDILQVKIQSVGEKGDGIARVKGYVLIIPGTKQGDKVKIKITKTTAKVGFAEVLQKQQSEREPETTIMLEPEPEYEDTEDFGEDLE